MGDIFSHYASQIGSFVGGLLAGAVGGSFLTFRLTTQKSVGRDGSLVDQSGASSSGDIVGGNKTTLNGRR